jgi:hypothetical protein
MHLRGVARDQHATIAVGGRLPRNIGEPKNRGGTVTSAAALRSLRMGSVVCPTLLFGHQEAQRPAAAHSCISSAQETFFAPLAALIR